ncbi:MAG TPA: lytic transglycosylase domain-containing protein [Thermoanaerobaculia bacterium]|nr:lytic transglycosylase domain-containing protein [Thermoanaerobaculia bacterium]
MLASLFVLAAVTIDPRVELVTLQQENRPIEALKLAERMLDEQPESSRALGVEYLVGHLLEGIGRSRDAVGIYASVMRTQPALRPYALLRVADIQTELGHPELSSGLLVSLLQNDPAPSLLRNGERLLVRALEKGGDCRVLEDLALEKLPASTRRRLVLYRLDCAPGSDAQRATALLDLLREDGTDLAASLAARRLLRLPKLELDPDAAAILGASLHHHREFEHATRHLAIAAKELPRDLDRRAHVDTLYLLMRSRFWTGDLQDAATGFGDLAERARRPDDRARALFQQGRCYELRGEWGPAGSSYRRAYLAEPTGELAAAGLVAAMRVEWRTGREGPALEILELLPTNPAWRDETARAALYLAISDLVRRRGDRAGHWLRQADLATGRSSVETSYWRGRLEEVAGSGSAAVDHYLETIGLDPYHPFAVAARERLLSTELRALAEEEATALAASHRPRDWVAAWRLLGDRQPSGALARSKLAERAAEHRPLREMEVLAPVPPSAWPLWQNDLSAPEETLLALGLWSEGASAALELFPTSRPALALTASEGLYRGGDVRRSIYVAEVLADRIGDRVPEPVWPRALRVRLHPVPYADAIARASRARGVEQALLLALLREESRFDPEAISVASARGMAQFVFPTAQELASRLGLGRLSPEDLANPVLSIELGAAYIAELLERFGGSIPEAVAAYNAGDRQVALWRTHCYGRDPTEFITKVSFAETRAYVERVLGARERYRDLYGAP